MATGRMRPTESWRSIERVVVGSTGRAVAARARQCTIQGRRSSAAVVVTSESFVLGLEGTLRTLMIGGRELG